ncbi:MAG: hypothetical protein LBB87_02275 [Nitrososphaerota archaeon]|jgi:hypothetical protein|nr:hypothetical protein [Nitrososphaerota archaeon]
MVTIYLIETISGADSRFTGIVTGATQDSTSNTPKTAKIKSSTTHFLHKFNKY